VRLPILFLICLLIAPGGAYQSVYITSESGRSVTLYAAPDGHYYAVCRNITVHVISSASQNHVIAWYNGRLVHNASFTGPGEYLFSLDLTPGKANVTVRLNGEAYCFRLVVLKRGVNIEELEEMTEVITISAWDFFVEKIRVWSGAIVGVALALVYGYVLAGRVKAGRVEELA